MKAFYFLIGIVCFALFGFQQARKRFSVRIHFESNMTPGIKYSLDQDRIKVFTSSDYSWKSSKVVYDKALTAKQSESIYVLLKSLRLDTLQSGYIYDTSQGVMIYDPLYTHFVIFGDKIKLVKTNTEATTTIATDSVISIMKSKLLPEKYYPFNLLR